MEGPCPTEGRERELRDVITLLDRHRANGAAHVGVGDLDDAQRRFLEGKPQRLRDPVPDNLSRRLEINRHPAAEQCAGVEAPESQVGIGDRRLRAAPAIGHRARIGAGRLRPDLERPGIIDPRDRTATGADHVDVEHRRLHGIAGHEAAGGVERRRLVDQRHVRRGATDVEGDQVGKSCDTADFRGPHDAGRRTRDAGPHGAVPHGRNRHQAAIRMDRVGLGRDAERLHAVAEAIEVASHPRADEGIDHRRRHALELAKLRQDFGGNADEDPREPLLDGGLGASLVLRHRVAMEEADRDALDAGGGQRLDRAIERRFVERHEGAPVSSDALHDFETPVARHEDRRLLDAVVIDGRPRLAAQFEDIPEALRGQQSGAGAAPLDHDVGGDRRPMAEVAHGGRRQGEEAEHLDEPRLDRFRGSWGVDGTLKKPTLPSASLWSVKSVKVPPTSTPMRIISTSGPWQERRAPHPIV